MSKTVEISCDPMNDRFAQVMEIFTWVGLAALAIFGLFYLLNVDTLLPARAILAHWQDPVARFWQEETGSQISGYLWLLTGAKHTDCLSLLGICVLALTPFFSVLAAIPRCSRKIHASFMIALTFEFGFCVIRPLVIAGLGH